MTLDKDTSTKPTAWNATTGEWTELQLDANNALNINLKTKIAGENQSAGLLRIEPQYDSFIHYNLASAQTLRAAGVSGVLHTVSVTSTAAGYLVITDADGTTWDGVNSIYIDGATLLQYQFDAAYTNGLMLQTKDINYVNAAITATFVVTYR